MKELLEQKSREDLEREIIELKRQNSITTQGCE
jgi:hypothetical protein